MSLRNSDQTDATNGPGVLRNYYDQRYRKSGFRTRLKRYSAFLDPLMLEAERMLLDVGCGEGYVLKIAQGKGLDCRGVDISEEAVRLARLKTGCTDAEILMADGEELPFEDRSFDYVTAIGSLEHFEHPEKGLQEIARVCRDDGKVCIVVPNSYGILNKVGLYKGTEQIQEKLATLGQWSSLLEENGLRIVWVGRDKGPSILKDRRPHKIVQRLLLRLTMFMPLCMAYQFVFICQKREAAGH